MDLDEVIEFLKEPRVLAVFAVLLVVVIALVFFSPKAPLPFVPAAPSGQCPANAVMVAQGCACVDGYAPAADGQSCVKQGASVPPTPSGCPANSVLNANGSCDCSAGFAPLNNNCVSLVSYCQSSFAGSSPKADGTGCECKSPLVTAPDGKSCVISTGTVNPQPQTVQAPSTPPTGGVTGFVLAQSKNLLNTIEGFKNSLVSGFTNVVSFPSLVLSGIGKLAGSVLSTAQSFAGNLVSGGTNAITGTFNGLVSGLQNTVSGATAGLTNTLTSAGTTLSNTYNNVVSSVQSTVSSVTVPITSGITNTYNAVVNTVSTQLNKATTCSSQGGYLFWC